MNIALVSAYSVRNVHNWSGTPFYMASNLEKHGVKIKYIDELKIKNKIPLKIKERFLKIKGFKFEPERQPSVIKHYSEQIKKQLLHEKIDIIFSPSSQPVALLDMDIPIVYWTDATFDAMIGFYPDYSTFYNETLKNGKLMEQAALDRCTRAIYSSEWAAKSVLEHYKVPESKIKVIPFGANIETDRITIDIKNIIQNKNQNKCVLLWLGIDWKRKGGDIAYYVSKKLNDRGIQTELHVVGCIPPLNKPYPEFLKVHGFVSKKTEDGIHKLNKLFESSHFLILPSMADCTPIVFCEANSFGLPVITTNVGGIPTIIKDNINGIKFNYNDSTDLYVNYIGNIFNSAKLYSNLALSTFNEYSTNLNWSSSTEKLIKLFKEII
ncbi:MAG: glycosyltransferase family 4 protein [Bacteroidales bacterium]|nr:glycosyltransferase family 4 protein [Bacteroidales bacterium]